MRRNCVKRKLKEGKTSVGTWIGIGHPDIPDILANLGFDWFVFDTEHGPHSIETVQHLIQAIGWSPTLPLVRVAWNDMVLIKRALDIGAYGVIIPWVNTKKEAENAVKYCHYPQSGGLRGCGPRKSSNYGFDREYFEVVDEELLIGIQIETETALNNLEDIFSVEGIDVAYVGPADLSMSLGIFGQFNHPKFTRALEMVIDEAKAAGIAPGIHCSVENINQYIEKGFRFNSLSSDDDLLIRGAVSGIKGIKGWKPLDSAPAAYLFK